MLKGVVVHKQVCSAKKEKVGEDDKKMWNNKRGGEKAEKEKQSNYQLGLEEM